jgi:hypothetical protein
LELMPPGIRDRALLQLLGDILGKGDDPAARASVRLRLVSKGFSWQQLVDLAIAQDVLEPLIFALAEGKLLIPAPRSVQTAGGRHVTSHLEGIYRQHLARRARQKLQLDGVLAVLNNAGIVPLILKGARYLVAPLGPWCEARTMRDIDILIQTEDGERAYAALVNAGYQRRARGPELNHHHLPELWRAGEPASLEIHTAVHSLEAHRVFSTEQAWRDACNAGSPAFLVLPRRWQALHCMVHHQIADHGYSRRILAVKALWEWAMLAHDFAREDWAAVVAHMRAAGAADELGSWLVQSQRLFGTAMPTFISASATARTNAEASFRRMSQPHWARRARFVADQLRLSFTRESLALRYGLAPSQVSARDAASYAMHLLRHHRGRVLRRLTGYRDRLS